MDIDLPYYLFWASVISGGIWAVDTWFFKASRLAQAPDDSAVEDPVLVEYARSFFPIFVVVFLLRVFWPNRIKFLLNPWCPRWKSGILFWSTRWPTA